MEFKVKSESTARDFQVESSTVSARPEREGDVTSRSHEPHRCHPVASSTCTSGDLHTFCSGIKAEPGTVDSSMNTTGGQLADDVRAMRQQNSCSAYNTDNGHIHLADSGHDREKNNSALESDVIVNIKTEPCTADSAHERYGECEPLAENTSSPIQPSTQLSGGQFGASSVKSSSARSSCGPCLQHGPQEFPALKQEPDREHMDMSHTPTDMTVESETHIYPTGLFVNDHVAHVRHTGNGSRALAQQTESRLRSDVQAGGEKSNQSFQNSKVFTPHTWQLGTPVFKSASSILPSTQLSVEQNGTERVSTCSDRSETTEDNYSQKKVGGMPLFSCKLCPATFTWQYYFRKHMKTHTGERPYACHLCPSTFTEKKGLKDHIRTHTGEKPFTCSQCSAAFAQQSNLKSHMRTHTGEKPYVCSLCPALYTSAAQLRYHVRTHTGEKPYKCTQCPAAFTKQACLKTHIRIHTGEKPFKCSYCTAAFTQLGHLKRHTRIHTGEKPYTCPECARAFRQLIHLKDHLRTHPERHYENSS